MIIYIIKLAQGPVFQKGVDFGEIGIVRNIFCLETRFTCGGS